MAKMRMGIDLSALFKKALKGVEADIQRAVHKEVGNKVGQISASTIHQQMVAKGIRRAKATGTHKKRSLKEQAAANRYGSMLDTYYKVWRSKDLNKDIVFAGLTTAAYKARFRNDGWDNHHHWGKNSGNSIAGKNYIDASKKILRRQVPSVVSSTMKQVLANPKKYKRKYRIG